MAKSLRSKWKRQMRAVKREQYDKKNLVKLKALVAHAEKTEKEEEKLYIMKKNVEKKEKASQEQDKGDEMEVEKNKVKFHSKTMKNKDGNYPGWMNQRQQKKMKKINGKVKRKALKGKK